MVGGEEPDQRVVHAVPHRADHGRCAGKARGDAQDVGQEEEQECGQKIVESIHRQGERAESELLQQADLAGFFGRGTVHKKPPHRV